MNKDEMVHPLIKNGELFLMWDADKKSWVMRDDAIRRAAEEGISTDASTETDDDND